MERVAYAGLRRCLGSGKQLRCSGEGLKMAACVATSICPVRNAGSASTASAALPKSISPYLVQRPRKTTLLSQRGYSTQESSIQGTIGKGEEGIQDEIIREQEILTAPEHLNEKEKMIWELLMKELQCTSLEVQDISGGCGSMYGIDVVSERFRGLNMLKQQRLVNQVLGEEIKGWHGVQLKTRAP
jgi:stress-induced morphogen